MPDHILGRRDFLAASAWAAASVPMAPLAALQTATGAAPRVPVVRVVSEHAVRGRYIHAAVLAEMLDLTLTRLTGHDTTAAAWRSLLRSDDLIGLKFNGSGAEAMATNEAFADTVITSLLAAGYEERQLVAIEAPEATYRRYGVIRPAYGWQSKPTDFGSGADQLSTVLDQVTAIVNMPFLKTHNIAGMTCALKNLSHGLIKHPARYHGNGCSPFIGDIVAAPPIGRKLRLCLVDALRVVHDGGPEAHAEGLSSAGILLAAFDPVATDRVGLSILNAIRRGRDLDPVARSAEELGYLAAAHRRGLGVALWDGIDRLRYRL